MNPALAQDPEALRVNLTAPTTSVRLGPFAFDGLKALIGMDLADALSPVMIGPRTQRTTAGSVVDVYPLAIPPGEGISLQVKFLGELGFYNMRGFLLLVVPPALVNLLTQQLAAEIAAGDAQSRLWDGEGGAKVCEFAIRLRPGMRKAIPLAGFGEFGVEAA